MRASFNHMRAVAPASSCAACVANTEYNRPLAACLYFQKNLSRHGKGAAALLRFGDKVRINMDSHACMWLAEAQGAS